MVLTVDLSFMIGGAGPGKIELDLVIGGLVCFEWMAGCRIISNYNRALFSR
jgi:hypothetical protein